MRASVALDTSPTTILRSPRGRIADARIVYPEVLHVEVIDGSQLVVVPAAEDDADDPPNWELITPDHLTLEFGPGLRWQIGSSDRHLVSRS